MNVVVESHKKDQVIKSANFVMHLKSTTDIIKSVN